MEDTVGKIVIVDGEVTMFVIRRSNGKSSTLRVVCLWIGTTQVRAKTGANGSGTADPCVGNEIYSVLQPP